MKSIWSELLRMTSSACPQPPSTGLFLIFRALAENPRPSSCRKLTGSNDDWRIIRITCDRAEETGPVQIGFLADSRLLIGGSPP